MLRKTGLMMACLLLAGPVLVFGSSSSEHRKVEALAKKLGVQPQELRQSPIPGVYEVLTHGDIGYVSADGRYYLKGDMFEMQSRTNLTDGSRVAFRKESLAAADEHQMIVFPAADPKYTITVFTDVDCTYCRKLHSDIQKYNDAGITVRYMAFPREGPKTADWTKMEMVWCAADRHTALTHAKLGEKVDESCKKKVDIVGQYNLGITMGVQGTPGLFSQDGRLLGGYLTVSQLLAQLNKSPVAAAAKPAVGPGADVELATP